MAENKDDLLLSPEEIDRLFLKYRAKLKEALSYSDKHFERASSVLAEAMRISEEAQLAKARTHYEAKIKEALSQETERIIVVLANGNQICRSCKTHGQCQLCLKSLLEGGG